MNMIQTPSSSSIMAYGWGLKAKEGKPATMVLSVVFHTGREYHYYDVPLAIFDRMQKAESVGQFVNREIKGKYKHEHVGEYK